MLLGNPMEEKQLDFNQPLLSVRRFLSTASTKEVGDKRKNDRTCAKLPPLPVCKSELKSGPVRNPGTVPFVWEKTPGRPKDNSKQKAQASEQLLIAPRLPPGRNLNVKQQASRSEGVVASQSQTKNGLCSSESAQSSMKNVSKEEKSKEEINETGSSGSDDEAYMDALDSLSRSESFFLNCSISGVSGLDGLDLEPSGTVFRDPNARDFMIGRFLPAAKAMASETPPHATRRQPFAREQPRQIKNAVRVEKRHPVVPYGPNNIRHYAHDGEVEESEDEDDRDNRGGESSLKVCGLFPRLCLQNSFCLTNPVPGLRKPAQAPISLVRTRKVKSANVPSCNQNDNENKAAMYNQRSTDGLQTKGMLEDKSEIEREHNWNIGGLSLQNHLQGNSVSPCHHKFLQHTIPEENVFHAFPEKSKNYEVNGFNLQAKFGSKFGELLANESIEWESGSASPVAEKTLYIDSAQIVKSKSSNTSSSDMKSLTNFRKDDVEILVKNQATDDTAFVDYSLQDIKQLNAAAGEKAKVRHESLESVESGFLSLSDRSIYTDVQIDAIDGCRQDQELLLLSAMTSPKVDQAGKIYLKTQVDVKSDKLGISHDLIQDSVTLTRGEVSWNEKIDLKRQLPTKSSEQEISTDCNSLLVLPPPLPKSPSESWLKRTLLTVSSRNSSRSSLGLYPRMQASPDPKWETIVKTSNIQPGHLQFSEELLAPIPES